MLPFTGTPLLTGPWLLNSITLTAFTAGHQKKWTDLSHHAQLSMCASRDKMAASGMEFSVLIECGFVAVVSWKGGWLCFIYTKFAIFWPDDWWVSFTRPWAVFTCLGSPDEWLVRTLKHCQEWMQHLPCYQCKLSHDDFHVFLYMQNHFKYYWSAWQQFLSFICYIRWWQALLWWH